MEESQTIDVTTGSTHVNSESPIKTIDSPKDSVEVIVEQNSAPPTEKKEEISPLGKRIRRASSKYEDVESKTLSVSTNLDRFPLNYETTLPRQVFSRDLSRESTISE